jgi:hypothetical protein
MQSFAEYLSVCINLAFTWSCFFLLNIVDMLTEKILHINAFLSAMMELLVSHMLDKLLRSMIFEGLISLYRFISDRCREQKLTLAMKTLRIGNSETSQNLSDEQS